MLKPNVLRLLVRKIACRSTKMPRSRFQEPSVCNDAALLELMRILWANGTLLGTFPTSKISQVCQFKGF